VVAGLLVPLVVAGGVLALPQYPAAAAGEVAEREGAAFLQRLMLLMGLGILLAVEWVYLKDFLAGGEWLRMNTVFKFYMQAWVLLGLACGSALPALWRALSRRRGVGARMWQGMAGLFLAAALVYPFLAIPARVNERFEGEALPRDTLDGTAYMTRAVYAWPDEGHRVELTYDREAIAWLWDHVRGTPVIAEAPLGFYREGGLRVSSYTGLPTLLGMHEREQRPWAQVDSRERDAEALYTTTDLRDFGEIVRRYGIRYIYVGQLERNQYAGPGLSKFEDLARQGHLERAYQNPRVTIYELPREEGA
jgi:uncharacterized membrane protein